MKVLYDCLGHCYREEGDPDQADYAYHSALNYDSSDFKAHDGIAESILQKVSIKTRPMSIGWRLTPIGPTSMRRWRTCAPCWFGP